MAIKHDAIVGRGRDIYNVDPFAILIQEGWNPRTDFSGEEELVAYVKENGPAFDPLRVKKLKDGSITLIAGERRLRAVKQAVRDGCDINHIPVIFERGTLSDTEAMYLTIFENAGKPLTPLEEAEALRRLRSWGVHVSGLAKRLGKSEVYVYRRLLLIDASAELKEEIRNRNINITDAEKIIKESNGSVQDQNTKIKKAKSKGKIFFKYDKKEEEITGTMKDTTGTGAEEVMEYIRKTLQPQSFEFWTILEDAGLDPETFKIECKVKAE